MPADVGRSLQQRIYEAAVLLPECGLLTGWAALAWRGARWFEGLGPDGATELPVVIGVVCRCVNDQPGMRVSQEFWPPTHVELVDGVPVATCRRAVGDLVRFAASDRAACKQVEMAAYSDLVSRDEMVLHAAEMQAHTGIGRLRTAAASMLENFWSPMEVELYEHWELTGAPATLCNRPVFDLDGRHVATPDLLDPVHGVAGEYEGGLHLEGSRRASDVSREAAMRRVGLEVVTMVSADRRDPGSTIIPRIAEAYARAARLPAADRGWTIDLPSWWIPTFTVKQRRALTESQRRRALRYRAA